MSGLLRADSWNVPLNGCGGAAQLRLLRQDTPSALFISQTLAREGSTSSGQGKSPQPQQRSGGNGPERVASNSNNNCGNGLERGGSLSSLLGSASGFIRANSINSPLSQLARSHSGLSALALPGVAAALQDDECLGSPAGGSPGFGSSLHTAATAASPSKVGSPCVMREPSSGGKPFGVSTTSPSPVAKRIANTQRFDEGSGCLSPVLIQKMGSLARPSSPATAHIWSPAVDRQSPSCCQSMKTASLSLSDTAPHEPETDSAESLTDSFQASRRESSEMHNVAESSRQLASMTTSAPSHSGGSPLALKTKQASRLARVGSSLSGYRSRNSKKRSAAAASSDGVVKPHSGLGRKKLARKPCVNCGTTDTPQWRQGVNGVRNLCNACGVRFRKGQLDHLYKVASSG